MTSRDRMPGWLAAALLGLVLAGRAKAIVNGAAVSEARFNADYPWAVALEDPVSGGVCSAQIIAPTWVLTAGHCTGTGMRILSGNASRAAAVPLTLAEAIPHPLYDARTGEYDVGLLRLARPAAAAPVAVVTRVEAAALLRPGARAVIAGWGKRLASLSFSERLVASDVELRSLTRDKTRFAYQDPVSGPCGGDSGGPLLLERPDGTRVLAGIASRVVGDLCTQGGGIGIYVDVAAIRDFLEQHVAELR